MRAVDLLSENVFRQLIEYKAVDSSLDGTCAELGVVAFVGKVAERLGRDFELDT